MTLSASRRQPGFHGWRVVISGAVVQAVQSALYIQGYGQYAVFLERQFGWSKTFLSVGFSLSRAQGGLMGPAQGFALDRFGPQRVIRVGIVVMSAGFFFLSRIQNRGQFLAAMSVIALGVSLSGFLSITTATVRWFERKRARALSMGSMGFAIGGASVPVLVWSLDRFGWRTVALGSAILVLVVALPATGAFWGSPADRSQHVDGVEPGEVSTKQTAEGVGGLHFTAAQAVRTRAFWMIALGHASALLTVGSVIAHLALYLTSEQGYSPVQASFVASVLPGAQLVGMLAGGFLGDLFNKRLLASLAMIGHMVALLLLAYATSAWMIWIFAPLHGFSWGVRGPLMQALRADYFGSSHFGKIMGLSSLVVMSGMVAGPLLSGWLADNTGSYRLPFTILAFVAGAGLVFFVLATPPKHPNEAELLA